MTPTASPPPAPPPAATPVPEPKRQWVRDGFYLRLIDGVGFMTLRGDGANGKASVSGMSSTSIIAIGGSVAPGLVLAGTLQSTQVGGDFKGGPFEQATITATPGAADKIPATKKATAALSQIGALLDWYPGTSGAHVGLGAGLGMMALINQADESAYYGTGVAGTVLVGYDWSIAPTWALGLALVANGSTKATLKHAKTGNESSYRMMPFSVGINASILYF